MNFLYLLSLICCSLPIVRAIWGSDASAFPKTRASWKLLPGDSIKWAPGSKVTFLLKWARDPVKQKDMHVTLDRSDKTSVEVDNFTLDEEKDSEGYQKASMKIDPKTAVGPGWYIKFETDTVHMDIAQSPEFTISADVAGEGNVAAGGQPASTTESAEAPAAPAQTPTAGSTRSYNARPTRPNSSSTSPGSEAGKAAPAA